MALSKLLYKEKVRQKAIEDVLGYGARSLGYFELRAEQKRTILSSTHRRADAQRSGSAPTPLSAAV